MFDKAIISASVVTYRTGTAELTDCLDMLVDAGVPLIYVIDNGNEPERIGLHCARYGETVIYMPGENIGYGAAHNKALRIATHKGTRYHLVVNTDITFDRNSLATLVDYMEKHEPVAMAHPRIVNRDGTDQYTVRRLPTPFDLILRRFLPSTMFTRRRDNYLLKNFDHSRELDVPYVQGSFMLLRMSCVSREGLFDERFFMYPEDIDLTRRLHMSNRTMYVPSATAIHGHRAASYRSLRMLWIHMVNMIRYFNKWGWIFDNQRRIINRRLDGYIRRSALQTNQSQLT